MIYLTFFSMKILFKDEIIIKTDNFTVAQDREVPIAGFFILSPNRHVDAIDEFTEEEMIEFVHLLAKVRTWMREALDIQDVYLFQNEDTSHNFHLRIFPRHERMEKLWRKIQSVRPIMDRATEHMSDQEHCNHVKECAKRMRTYFKKE